MNTPTLLLVEDDRLILRTLADELAAAGFRILEADSGESAVKLCSEANRPDLALLDMRLPGMSGIDFARWLKNTLDVPFLFLSAYGDPETVTDAVEIGALGYLVKPLDTLRILPSITAALQRAQEIQKLRQAEINLGSALKTSRAISMAIGLLMERLGAGADEAFEVLRSYCRNNRKKMVEVAEQIVANKMEASLSSCLENYMARQRGKS